MTLKYLELMSNSFITKYLFKKGYALPADFGRYSDRYFKTNL